MNGAEKASRPVFAIDLGGSKIAVAIISPEYKILAREYHPTLADEGAAPVIDRITAAVKQITAATGTALPQTGGIGIAAAGAIDHKSGLVTLSPNLPGWRDVPLRALLQERLGSPTWLINDANAAALGEHRLGAGRGVNDLIYLTVGTGIGGAIITNGRLYTGACGSAGEIGHMTIDINGPRCACGNTGCLETLASGRAIAREAIRRLGAGESSSLTGLVNGKTADITAREVAVAAEQGDLLAVSVIDNAAFYLGVGLVNLVNIFNPEMIIIGGGVASLGERLLNPARRLVKERAFPVSSAAVSIVATELGRDAGLLGAARFAFEQAEAREEI
ncbi:MAG: ROK family protein [Dehalococcoidales bacterium]|nr:ROK family protein [Dehalococcoidales bacterium]